MSKREYKILVVDDDEMLRKTLAAVLSSTYDVVMAGSGREAFRMIQDQHIDVVLSDVYMADGTGIELLEWIRARHPSKPAVVLVTGYSLLTPEEAVQKGAYGIVNKPFKSKLLLEMIHTLIQTHVAKPSV